MALHTGKLDWRIDTSVTEEMCDAIATKAHALGIPKADFVRELLFLGMTQETYTFHVAKDKAAAIKAQLEDMRDRSCTRRAGDTE